MKKILITLILVLVLIPAMWLATNFYFLSLSYSILPITVICLFPYFVACATLWNGAKHPEELNLGLDNQVAKTLAKMAALALAGLALVGLTSAMNVFGALISKLFIDEKILLLFAIYSLFGWILAMAEIVIITKKPSC